MSILLAMAEGYFFGLAEVNITTGIFNISAHLKSQQ